MINSCAYDLLKWNNCKSIALPVKLQGYISSCLIFVDKVQINQQLLFLLKKLFL